MTDLRSRLSRFVLTGVHVGLIGSVFSTLYAVELPLRVRIPLLALVLLPLLVTLPGVIRLTPGVLPWLALALVAYTGLGTVEVMASGTLGASLTLLLALLEMALLLVIRRSPGGR